jgi:hypothetical protein
MATHPDAAWRPRPRDPPVTTATFPFKENMDEKSSSLTSASADMLIWYYNIDRERNCERVLELEICRVSMSITVARGCGGTMRRQTYRGINQVLAFPIVEGETLFTRDNTHQVVVLGLDKLLNTYTAVCSDGYTSTY